MSIHANKRIANLPFPGQGICSTRQLKFRKPLAEQPIVLAEDCRHAHVHKMPSAGSPVHDAESRPKPLIVRVGLSEIWKAELYSYLVFMKEKGTAPDINSYDAHEKSLAAWFTREKAKCLAGKLSKEQASMLVDAGLVSKSEIRKKKAAEVPRREANWNRKFKAYFKFIKTHGKEPAKRSKNKSEHSLAIWAATQIYLMYKSKLSEEHRKKLDDAGFVFSVWDKNLRDFLAFFLGGRLPSLYSHDAKERHLYVWRLSQFKARREGTLSEIHLAKLNEALFFNLLESCRLSVHDIDWNVMFNKWKLFKEIHGFKPSQVAKDPEEKKLGVWAKVQKSLQKQGKLKLAREEKLRDADFEFGMAA